MPTDNEFLRLIYLKVAPWVPTPSAVISNSGSPSVLSIPGQGLLTTMAGRSRVSIGIRVTNINTDVGIGLYCNLISGGRDYPLSADGSSILKLTANGTYLYTWEGTAESIFVRFESESGGTDAQVEVIVRAQ